MNLSSCGIDCDACKFKEEKGCLGCHVLRGKPFWGECDLYACAAEKSLPHCGKCKDFACDMLKEWEAQEGDGRIQNLIDFAQ